MKSKTTVQAYKSVKRLHNTLNVGKYVVPCIPVVVTTGINWEEWFGKQGTSLPFGLATMLLAVLAALFSYSKTKNEKEQKVSPFFYIGATLGIFAISFMLLSNILSQMGFMFMFVVFGILTSGIMDQVDNTIIKERVEEYRELVKDNELDPKLRKKESLKKQRLEKAKLEREKLLKAEREGATE